MNTSGNQEQLQENIQRMIKMPELSEEFVCVICPACSGEGKYFNTFFEQCRHEDWRNEVGVKQGDCDYCENQDCREGELIVCNMCEGKKVVLQSQTSKKYYNFTQIGVD